MSPIIIAGLYGLIGGIIGSLLAAITAIMTGRRVKSVAIGTALSGSGGFILGVAFLALIGASISQSNNTVLVGTGIALGLLLMVGLDWLLWRFRIDEEDSGATSAETPEAELPLLKARLLAIGIGIHNMPEALPIGAALAISPRLSLLIALVMTVENFAESGAIAGELVRGKASTGHLLWETTWPGLFSVIGAPMGVILAGISPVLLALTLSLAAGLMLFIGGEVWADGRRDAGVAWSSIGLLLGVLLALVTSTTGAI